MSPCPATSPSGAIGRPPSARSSTRSSRRTAPREFETWVPRGRRPTGRRSVLAGRGSGRRRWSIGARSRTRDEDHGDYKLADLAIEQIKACRATSRSSSRSVQPAARADLRAAEVVRSHPAGHGDPAADQAGDRDDTPAFSWYLHWKLPEPRLSWYEKFNEEEPFVRAYLAGTSFVDAQFGRVLAALKRPASTTTRSSSPSATTATTSARRDLGQEHAVGAVDARPAGLRRPGRAGATSTIRWSSSTSTRRWSS